MKRRVRTPDAVAWTVRVGRPRWRAAAADLSVGSRASQTARGFVPLVLVAGVVMLVVLSPVLVETGRAWALVALPVLGLLLWSMLGRYPVDISRDGDTEPLHRTWVTGRRRARQVADELAAEIARTPDDDLTA